MSNLLPKNEKRSILRMYRKRYVALGLFFFAMLGAASIVMLVPSYRAALAKETDLSSQHAVLAGEGNDTDASALAVAASGINAQLKAFPDAPPAPSPIVAGFVAPIISVEGKAIHLTGFDYKLGTTPLTATVTVTGTADSRDDLSAFSDRVKALTGFSGVNVPIGSFIKDIDVPFSLSATVSLKN